MRTIGDNFSIEDLKGDKKINSILYVYLPLGENVKLFPTGISCLANYIHRIFPEIDQHILDLSVVSARNRWNIYKKTLTNYSADLVAFSWRHVRYFGAGLYDKDLRALRFSNGRHPADILSFLRKGYHRWRHYADLLATNIRFIRWARQHLKGSHVVVGGPGFSIFHEAILKKAPEGVIGFIGEGERLLADLIRGAGYQDQKIVFRKGYNICKSANAIGRENLFDIKKEILAVDYEYISTIFPDYDAYQGQTIGVETNRGCSQRCVYCPPSARDRKMVVCRDPQEIIREILCAKKVFKTNKIWFTDHLVVSRGSHEKFSSVLKEIIRRSIQLHWSGYMRPDVFTRELAALIVKSGLSHFIVPVTSGSQSVADQLKLGLNIPSVLNGCRLLSEAGYQGTVDVELTFGILPEKHADIEDTVKLYKEIKKIFRSNPVKAILNFCSVLPGSELEADLLDRGYFSRNYNPMSINPWVVKKFSYVERTFSKLMEKAYEHVSKNPADRTRSTEERVLDYLLENREFRS